MLPSQITVDTPQLSQIPKKLDTLRVRNNSDIHLDGVLLEGDGGSDWSLSSVDSSQSNKSQDNPPAYFQIPQDSSWEDCKGIQHLLSRERHHSSNYNSNQNHVAQTQNYNLGSSANNGAHISVNHGVEETNGEISVKTFDYALTLESPLINLGTGVHSSFGAASIIENGTCSISSTNCNGVSVSPASLSSGVGRTTNLSNSSSSSCRQSPLSLPSSSSSLSSNQDTESGCFHTESGDATKLARTNPMAVPGPRRVHHHHRPESASSASIGRLVQVIPLFLVSKLQDFIFYGRMCWNEFSISSN